MAKLKILVLSNNTDSTFRWQSVGWGTVKNQAKNPELFKERMAAINKIIVAGKDVPDTIKRLRKAGYSVKQSTALIHVSNVCNKCIGAGEVYDKGKMVTCPKCHGDRRMRI